MPALSRPLQRRCRDAAKLVACAALLSACDNGPSEPRDRGSYRATITGSVNETAEGIAGFTTASSDWGVFLLPAQLGNGWDMFIRGAGPRPPAGAVLTVGGFHFEDPPSAADVIVDVSRSRGPAFDFWGGTSGEIRITSSSASRLSGTFEISAESFLIDGLGPITITGTFDASFLGSRPTFPLPPLP